MVIVSIMIMIKILMWLIILMVIHLVQVRVRSRVLKNWMMTVAGEIVVILIHYIGLVPRDTKDKNVGILCCFV